jgi:hypothetical protein
VGRVSIFAWVMVVIFCSVSCALLVTRHAQRRPVKPSVDRLHIALMEHDLGIRDELSGDLAQPTEPNPGPTGWTHHDSCVGVEYKVTEHHTLWLRCTVCGSWQHGPELAGWPYRDATFDVNWRHACTHGAVTVETVTLTYA